MRVPCNLREIRGEAKSLREIEEETGVGRGSLSLYERGRAFPPDDQVPALEEAYGAPAHEWWPAAVLLLIERDRPEGDTP